MYTNILMPTEGSELAQGYPAQHRLGQADRRQSSASLGRIIKLEFIAGEYSGGQSQPTFLFCNRPNFDLVINLKTAQPLGIEIPCEAFIHRRRSDRTGSFFAVRNDAIGT